MNIPNGYKLVPVELLENLLHCGDTASTVTPFVTARLREIISSEVRTFVDRDERSLFVKWLRSRPHVLNVGFNKETGKYVLREDEDSWQGWIACAQSRAKSVEVGDE